MEAIQIKEFDSVIDLLEELDREGITGQARTDIYKRYMNLRARMLGRPYSGGFELTPLCNFDCKMCYVHLNREQMGDMKLLSTQQWIYIMDQAIDAGMLYADLTGGECLSYSGFRELYLHLRSRGVGVSVMTNGQLITEDMADFFTQYPPTKIQISVYGNDEDTYEAVTGCRAFADVLAAIERLKKRKLNLSLAVTPNRYMQSDTHSLLAFLRATGVPYVVGIGSLAAREETGRSLSMYAPENALYVKLHLDEQEYHRSHSAAVSVVRAVPPVDYVPTGIDQLTGKLPCSSGRATFHINWKGEMTPCIPFDSVHRSVPVHGFADSWEWIKQQMSCYSPPEECINCSQNRICQACPAERTQGILNGSVNPDVCERYRQFIHAGLIRLPTENDCK